MSMKRLRAMTIAISLLAALPAVIAAFPAEIDPAIVRDRVEAYEAVWNTRDARALGAFFSENADLVMGNQPPARGREAIEDWWRAYFERQEPTRRASFDVLSSRLLRSDVALINIASTTSGADDAGRPLVTRKARGTWLLRQRDGDWMIEAMRGMPTEEDRVELVSSLETEQALRTDIRGFVAAYEDVFNRHDPVALSELYRDDADLIIREGPITHGKPAILAMWQAYFSQPRPYRALLIPDEIRMIAEDVALLNVIGTGAPLAASDTPVPNRQARATWVVVREDGAWRLAALRVLPSESDRIIRESSR